MNVSWDMLLLGRKKFSLPVISRCKCWFYGRGDNLSCSFYTILSFIFPTICKYKSVIQYFFTTVHFFEISCSRIFFFYSAIQFLENLLKSYIKHIHIYLPINRDDTIISDNQCFKRNTDIYF